MNEAYVRDELRAGHLENFISTVNSEERTLLNYYRKDSPDLFEKCRAFYEMVQDHQQKQLFQRMYRVTLVGPLDHTIQVFNPITQKVEEFLCFDSNSYLGLHLHPRVLERVKHVLGEVGYGTPSAQLLCGTNRYLRELEETISQFHNREDALVFPSGYSTNTGILNGLVRKNDLVASDRFCHASIQDACRSLSQTVLFPHGDMKALDEILAKATNKGGKLIATDGLFSMHGVLADLPKLLEIARRHGAKLLVDEAHSTGVIGPTGKGLEEHFGLEGSIDVLMGTFSKALGTSGGYVTGSKELIYYLRFFANSGLFTASLPAHLCAGLTEGYRILEQEPEHRERLWNNIRYFTQCLQQAGFCIENTHSPIVTIPVGSEKRLWALSCNLFDQRLKCGNVVYPAVPKGEAILRLTLNARHTKEDLDRAVEILTSVGKAHDILGKTLQELKKEREHA